MTKNLAQNEIGKDRAHHQKIARISILENDILFERYGRLLSLLQIVQLCLKVPYLVHVIYFTWQKWSLLFYFVLKGVLALFCWVAQRGEGKLHPVQYLSNCTGSKSWGCGLVCHLTRTMLMWYWFLPLS